MSSDVPSEESPSRFTGLKLIPVSKTAAGIPAVVQSAKHILSEMNVGRGWKALIALNQKDGYDCPGCAWPDPDNERSRIAEYCENGAKAIAEEATTKTLREDFFENNSVADLAALSDYEIGKKGRIAQPVYLPKGGTHYQPISWNDAFEKIAGQLNALDSPDESIFYTSGRTSNEAAFLYQLLVREFGTNNLPDCSNMCHESSGVALAESLGIGKGSVTLQDFYKTEVIIILGQNPGTNHPRMLSALQDAKKNGCKIISVNPLRETGLMGFKNPQKINGLLGIKSGLADIFLQVKINGDMALLQALELLLLEEEEKNPGKVFDHEFIAHHTSGFESFVNHLKKQNLDDLLLQCAIERKDLLQAFEILKHKKKIIACWAMGLTQHKNAVNSIREIVNLLLLKGSIGISGGGTCPVRGHSNVQGDRTMGIYEKPSEKFCDSIQHVFGFDPPRKAGYDTVDAIHAMHNEKAKVFIAMGGNFLSATPDTKYTAEAMRKCKLTVHISTKLNRSHLVHGEEAIILPCLARSDKDMLNGVEQFVTTENSMGIIQSSKGNLQPVSEDLLSEPAIVCHLAKALMGNRSLVNWDKYLTGYDNIRDDIEKTIPGFKHYNVRVRKPGGFYLPHSSRHKTFTTSSGKAEFNISEITRHLLADDELMMMTIRSHDQFNTTIYGLNDRYRGVLNERRVIFMNAKDISNLALKAGDEVDIYNYEGGIERIAHRFIIVEYNIPEKCTATYFPETNVLVPIGITADKSNTPVSKSVVVKVKKRG